MPYRKNQRGNSSRKHKSARTEEDFVQSFNDLELRDEACKFNYFLLNIFQ